MTDLRQISIAFIKRSKALTFSGILSVFVAVVLILSMWNFSLNATESYQKSLKAAYGDCDMLVTYDGYNDIENDIIAKIEATQGVSAVASGRFDASVNIEGNDVYTIGAIDHDMIKSRYHYTVALGIDEIVINKPLADSINKTVGDFVKIHNKKLRISQVIEDKMHVAGGFTMAVMTQETLATIVGSADKSNFIMVKTNEQYPINGISNNIQMIDSKLNILLVEGDPLYKASIKTFGLFFKALAGIVLLVAGLFVTSILHNFLYKYNHDMAIIRAIGGSAKQIKYVFMLISIVINGIACSIGFIVSIFLNKIVLKALNSGLNLIEGEIKFYGTQSFVIVTVVFGLILLFLLITIKKNSKILPLEAIIRNEVQRSGKKKKQRKVSLGAPLNRLLVKEVYLGIKLIIPKMKENLFLILTIMMIIMLTLIGSSLNSLIQHNNSRYIKDEYLTDIVVTSSNHINYEDSMKIFKEIDEVDGVVASLILQNGSDTEIILSEDNIKGISYRLADLESMQQQGIMSNVVQQKERVILSTEVASELGKSIGDKVTINTPKIYKTDNNGVRIGTLQESYKKELVISGTLPKSKMQYMDAYVDIRNTEYIQEHMGLLMIYISGNLDEAERVLNEIKMKHAGLKWSNYQEVMEFSAKTIKERFFMFEIVIGILVFVAGIGWFNSMRSIILSRTREYCILRIQGVSVRSLQVVVGVQIVIYLLSGIILGFILGSMCLTVINYLEMGTLQFTMNAHSMIKIILYMFGLSIFLYPSVKKVSKHSLIIPY